MLKAPGGIGIDIALAGFPFEEEIIDRASGFEFLPGLVLRTCSVEDLIVLKAFASRTQDWADIEGILTRSGPAIDRFAVEERLGPLAELKGDPAILPRLQDLFQSLSSLPIRWGCRTVP